MPAATSYRTRPWTRRSNLTHLPDRASTPAVSAWRPSSARLRGLGLLGTDSPRHRLRPRARLGMTNTGWLFVLVGGFVVFVVAGRQPSTAPSRSGRDDEEPEFKTVSRIAMMFSAGMGIGLMFSGPLPTATPRRAPRTP